MSGLHYYCGVSISTMSDAVSRQVAIVSNSYFDSADKSSWVHSPVLGVFTVVCSLWWPDDVVTRCFTTSPERSECGVVACLGRAQPL